MEGQQQRREVNFNFTIIDLIYYGFLSSTSERIKYLNFLIILTIEYISLLRGRLTVVLSGCHFSKNINENISIRRD